MRNSKTLPWFKVYADNWIALVTAEELSTLAEGCLIRLLVRCWRNGSIPRDRSELARICGTAGPDLDAAIAQLAPLPDDPSRLHSPSLEAERDACARSHARKSAGGKAAMKRRWARPDEPPKSHYPDPPY